MEKDKEVLPDSRQTAHIRAFLRRPRGAAITLLVVVALLLPLARVFGVLWQGDVQLPGAGPDERCIATWRMSPATGWREVHRGPQEVYVSSLVDGRWSVPATTLRRDVNIGGQSLSCPVPGFCMIAWQQMNRSDWDLEYATFDKGTWSGHKVLTANNKEEDHPSLSCPNSSYCMLVWQQDTSRFAELYALTWSGGTWSAPTAVTFNNEADIGPSVLCTNPEFCMLTWTWYLGDDAVFAYITWNGSAWSPPGNITIAPGRSNTSPIASCTSPDFCMAMWDYDDGQDREVHYSTWDGSGWSPATGLTNNNIGDIIDSLSCPISDFCMALWSELDYTGGYRVVHSQWTGGAWTTPDDLTSSGLNDFASSVSCTSPSSCVVVWLRVDLDEDSEIMSAHWSPAGWSGPVALTRGSDSNDEPGIVCTR